MDHRAISSDDLEAIHRLYMDDDTNPYLDYEPMALAEFRPVFAGLVEAGETFLAFDGGRLLGTYRLHVQALRCAHVATLGALVVSPELRGSGLGGRLLEAIVERARARCVRRVELFVEADNPRAIRLYERHGFEREGVFRGAFRRRRDAADVDEIAMARMLTGAVAVS